MCLHGPFGRLAVQCWVANGTRPQAEGTANMAGIPTRDLQLERPADQPPPSRSNTPIVVVLVGILLTLLGILYVAVRYTGVFDTPAAEARCESLRGDLVVTENGGTVCDLPPVTPPGERFGPEDYPIDEWARAGVWTDKERHCQDIGGSVAWAEDGSKVCDIPPFTSAGELFGPTDWIIEWGQFVNPSYIPTTDQIGR